jgi:hypothetical protein
MTVQVRLYSLFDGSFSLSQIISRNVRHSTTLSSFPSMGMKSQLQETQSIAFRNVTEINSTHVNSGKWFQNM